jgi:DNA invertase Pin-like site-specific DNA recombinase
LLKQHIKPILFLTFPTHVKREACEAFIKSQAGEGWRLVKTAYDDGGLSGGTMERSALQRLLADVNQGAIDVVVVYKVDRLTRSLTDFAKMVEVFDAHAVSFVAVTQQFNTTSSMAARNVGESGSKSACTGHAACS